MNKLNQSMNEMQKLFQVFKQEQTISSYEDMVIYKRSRKKSWEFLGLSEEDIRDIRLFKIRRGIK